MNIGALGISIAQARISERKFESYPADTPHDLVQAYAIQDAMRQAMGIPVVGWKVGVTSLAARQALGVEEPMSGPLFQQFVSPSPAKSITTQDNLRIVEAEIGFVMGRTFAPRNMPYERDEIKECITSVHPVFEMANKRLPGGMKDDIKWLIADGAMNHALIYGQGHPYTPNMDMVAETVSVLVDTQQRSHGSGANVLGDPLNVVVWLVNHLNSRNISLNKGDWVSTGLMCDVISVDRGSTIEAHFSTLGSISLEMG